jgi:alpha-1,3-mannosylglycoprotein beta-1,4-N-acetylglucosaminyltransferase A/B
MAYCRNRGSFYLNLEDDVLSRPRFITDINRFIRTSDKLYENKWLMLEFSELGFIGKLFRTRYNFTI